MIVLGLFLVVICLLAVLPGWLAGPLSWLLVGYVLFRAWPGIRADVARRPSPSLRRPQGRGAHL